ncbi:MAG TPA: family 16 glycosylhydrolase [Pseudolysinimonas sp.]|nr:family 16 glycosylhydrolase [Pseudolysinimonas sp.]
MGQVFKRASAIAVCSLVLATLSALGTPAALATPAHSTITSATPLTSKATTRKVPRAPAPKPTSTAAPVTTTQSSASLPVGNLPGWTQTAVQDFSTPAALGQVGTIYGADMRGYSGFPDTSKHGIYTPDSVLSVSNGMLDYYLHSSDGVPRVATPIPFGYAGQTYGRYSVRFRSDYLPGYKIAFLLWPTSDNWNEGEIDWPEGSLNGKMSPASAIKGSLSPTWNMSFDAVSPRSWSATDSSTWHVATTEWTPGLVKWFWDGALVAQTSIPAGVPTTNFRWTLQAETEIGAPAPAASTAGHLQVDWVAQYAYTP